MFKPSPGTNTRNWDLPSHAAGGPCKVAVAYACQGRGIHRANPLAMIPGSTWSRYTVICQACYDLAAQIYVRNA